MTQLPLINTCIYLDCLKPAKNRLKPGYCRMHLSRIGRHGNADTVKGVRGDALGPYCALFIVDRGPNDYWATTINRQTVLVHKLIAEHILERKLHPDEHVHHEDGNGLNNSPDNLDVMFANEHNRLSGGYKPSEGDPF